MKKKKDTTEFDKQEIKVLLHITKDLAEKIKERPNYYNQHPIECVKPLIDIIGKLLTESLNKNQGNDGVYKWHSSEDKL
jgi:hypothetical protein